MMSVQTTLTTLRTLGSRVARHAALTPDAPALVVGDLTRGYGELDETARRWAAAVTELRGGRAHRVGVFAYRSEVAYSGVLAALYSGAAFVPLNPTFPHARTRSMIEQAQLDAIVVDTRAAGQLEAVLQGITACPPILAPALDSCHAPAGVPVLTRQDISGMAPLAQLPTALPEDIAYLLFTSGSTGVPKGVPVSHGNVMHFLDYVTRRYRIRPEDRFSQTFDQTFDLSVFDVFAAWENGACLCAMQPLDLLAPARFISRHGVTVWFSVPSIPALMRKKNLLKPNAFPTLRWSLFCGEPLPRASADAWQAAAPNSIVENLYGPTELTIACFQHRWDPARSPALCVNDLVAIGTPYDGLTELVIDEDRRPVVDGEAGELCVSGPQTVPGYWNAPAKTAEQFVELPLKNGGRARFYRTGDRVRRLPSGDYVYLGRIDHQVKVLGHRVELAEIDAALARQHGVTQAVALGWPVQNGSAEGIVAFVSGADVNTQQITAAVRQMLPDYMIPRAIVVLDSLPLNANGKVDRTVLLRGLDSGEYAVQMDRGARSAPR